MWHRFYSKSLLIGFIIHAATAHSALKTLPHNPYTDAGNITYYNGPYISVALNPLYLSVNELQLYNLNSGAVLTASETTFNRSQLGFGGSLGYSLVASNIPMRMELEYLYMPQIQANFNPLFSGSTPESAQIKSKISNQTLMFNMTYDFVNDSRYLPFFIGGLGFTDTLAKTRIMSNVAMAPPTTAQYYSNDNINMSWNAGLGMRVKVQKRIFIDLMYRYMRLGSINWGTLRYPNSTKGSDGVKFSAFQVYANTLSLKASMQW